MSDSWRAFIGCWDDGHPDITILDLTDLSWDEARDHLVARLVNFVDDDCPWCKSAGIEALTKLRGLDHGGTFEEMVDGYEYVIIAADWRPEPLPATEPGQWENLGCTTDGSDQVAVSVFGGNKPVRMTTIDPPAAAGVWGRRGSPVAYQTGGNLWSVRPGLPGELPVPPGVDVFSGPRVDPPLGPVQPRTVGGAP